MDNFEFKALNNHTIFVIVVSRLFQQEIQSFIIISETFRDPSGIFSGFIP
jgi:hypothetical protein